MPTFAPVMSSRGRFIAPVAVLLSVSLALFAFFTVFYPFHLFHREQYSLFLTSGEFVRQMLSQGVYDSRSWLPSVVGGYLTQFYYFIGGGPAVVSVVLFAIGAAAFFLAHRLRMGRWVALALAVAVVLWEAGRQCAGEYQLASSLSLLFGLLAALAYPVGARLWARCVALVVISFLCVSSLGYGGVVGAASVALAEAVRRRWLLAAASAVVCLLVPHYGFRGCVWFGRPDFDTEAFLRADTRTWRGEVIPPSDFSPSVRGGRIGNSLLTLNLVRQYSDLALDSIRWDACELFLPVDPSGGYIQFTTAGEVWFALGDMTMAEHATMLGMIFSPQRMGSRHIRRLAEISLVRADTAAADKYLAIMGHSSVLRAKVPSLLRQAMPGGRLDALRRLAPQSDTLRASSDYRRSLRNLLTSNPDNDMARVYLLALDMQRKEMADFLTDYLAFARGRMTRAYAEALMVVAATAPQADRARLASLRIPDCVVRDFKRFNELMERGDKAAMRCEFANSYWLYCQK
ncbi:MAG: DUF6057 family protein [Marinilabiliaceae bacterium]